jgi:hypothetical protein
VEEEVDVEEKVRREAVGPDPSIVGDEVALAVAAEKRFPVDSVGTGRPGTLGFDSGLAFPDDLNSVGIAVQMTSQPNPAADKTGTGSSDFVSDDDGIESVGPGPETAERLI